MLEFTTEGRVELLKAFITAQSEMDGAKKTANNPAFKSKYADLAAVCDAVMEALTKNKIGVIQAPSFDDEGLHIQTMFVHESGGAMWETISIRPTKTDPQGLGSAITYLRRYSLAAMCGIAPEDDDANAASGVRTARTVAKSIDLKADGTWQKYTAAIDATETLDALQAAWKEWWPAVKDWNQSWNTQATDYKDEQKVAIMGREMDKASEV